MPLPPIEPTASLPANTPGQTQDAPVKILLVDEPAAAGREVQQALAQAHPGVFLVEQVNRLAAALPRLEQSRYQAVLLALSLPDSQGLDTYLRLRQGAPDLAVVVLTSPEEEALGHIAVREGAQECLGKDVAAGPQLARALALALHRQRLQAEMLPQALTDRLTGLVNLRGFQPLAEQHWRLAYRTNRPFVLVVADVDGMHQINANLGHRMGDAALRQAARIIQQSFRDSDILARLGGDEFAILITEVPDDRGQGLVARLQKNFRSHNLHAQPGPALTLRVGTAYFDPAEPVALATLLENARAVVQAAVRRA